MADITAQFDPDEALVLFELLSRWSTDGKPLSPADPGEEIVLNSLLAQLERQLVDPFRADYAARLAEARAAIRV